MDSFNSNNQEIIRLIAEWEPKLISLNSDVISQRRNRQDRTIKQILGHMVDSASNNTHRIIHLQYQTSPLIFPDYANNGNNDRWIAIQNYQSEDWANLVQLWKHSNLHFVHVVKNVDISKLNNEWISALNDHVTLENMITDYLRHFQLHLSEIQELIDEK